MTSAATESRPYHHGDLSRALVDAARRILENEGPAALSLRAVAREAGVSPAAPYHHFKDKSELLEAVAHEGWHALDAVLIEARASAKDASERMTGLGVAYVKFARENPALYRVMYDRSRDKDSLPDQMKTEGAYCQVRDTISEQRRRCRRHRPGAGHHRRLVRRPWPGRDDQLQAVRPAEGIAGRRGRLPSRGVRAPGHVREVRSGLSPWSSPPGSPRPPRASCIAATPSPP
jgi:AcrR family transcriptional regulator